jgi:hydrogenase 3 maturation protease
MEADHPLLRQLGHLRGSKAVILGVGNLLRGDDAAGVLICERLAGNVSAQVIDAGTVPENYLRPVVDTGPESLVILDAVNFGERPGAVQLFEPHQILSAAFSTHALSPRLFVELLQHEIEAAVYFIGIQPAHTRLSEPVSPAVQQAIDTLTQLLTQLFPLDS